MAAELSRQARALVAESESMPPPMRRLKLIDASRRFNSAKRERLSLRDMLSVEKSLAAIARRLVAAADDGDAAAKKHWYGEATRSYSAALFGAGAAARREHGDEWALSVEQRLQDCAKEAALLFGAHYACDSCDPSALSSEARGELCLEVAHALYRRALPIPIEEDGFPALPLLDEAERPLRDAERLGAPQKLTEQLRKECGLLRSAVCSHRAWRRGNRFVQRAVHGSEELDMDAITLALDAYKEAECEVRARSGCMEREIRAVLSIAKLYDEVLRNTSVATRYYQHGIQLVLSSGQPAKFVPQPWYKEANARLERIRDQQQKQQSESKAEAEKPVRQKLAKELEKLQDIAQGEDPIVPFLKHIYAEHARCVKGEIKKWDLDEEDQLKKAMMQSLTHFHPDRHMSSDIEVRVLAEEITKFLNTIYEQNYKS